VSIPVSTPYTPSAAITTSSKAALPARSPIPLTDTCAWSAPASNPASALAVAIPKSSWVWTSTRASVWSHTVWTSRPNRRGVATPQVSGTFTQSTPTSSTASITSIRNDSAVRVASIGENITSAPASRTCRTAATDRSIASVRLACIESANCTSLVEQKTWTVSTPASRAAVTSSSTTRARPTTSVSTVSAISATAANSSSETAGKPASTASTPISASAVAV